MGQSNTKVNESNKIKENNKKKLDNQKLSHLNILKNIRYITILKKYFYSLKSKTKLKKAINILNCLHLKLLYFNIWFTKQKQFYIEKYHIGYRKILKEISYTKKNIMNNRFNQWLCITQQHKYIRILNKYSYLYYKHLLNSAISNLYNNYNNEKKLCINHYIRSEYYKGFFIWNKYLKHKL